VEYAIRKTYFGPEELVYAIDLANDPHVHQHLNSKFICPECKEPVRFINGEERTYFRHLPNNPKTQNCPNYYSDNNYAAQYLSQQERYKSRRQSKRLYILKRGESFGLFLGFPPLEEETVVAARNENLVVQINNPNNAELKENRLFLNQVTPGEITYVWLKWIYDYYSFKYSECSVNDDIEEIWEKDQSGLPEKGALFRYSNNYARCISDNGEVTTDKYYYFATASKLSEITKDFLEYEFVGKLEGRSFGYESKWKIYRVQFTKATENALEFADNLGVNLIEWHPPLIPLWPPHVQLGDRQIYSKSTKVLTLAQKTDTSSYHQEIEGQYHRSIPKTRIKTGWLLYHSAEGSMCIKSSDGGYEAHLTCGFSDKISHYLPPEITLEYDKKPLENGDCFPLKDKANLSLKSDSKCNIYHYSEKQLKSVYWSEQAILTLLNLSEGDRICVRHGMDVVYRVSVQKCIQTVVRNSIQSDEKMYQELALTGGIFISTPVKVKYILNRLGKCPKVSGYLRNALKSGKIPQKAYCHLISELDQEIRE